MYFLFINPLFADKIIQALCWMLVHSLWQGLLLALLAGIFMLATKKSPA
jgi:bla regulator protein blaR1